MSYKPKNAPKTKRTFDVKIKVKGEEINLGKLITITLSRCSITKRTITNYTCVNTGKKFTCYKKASNYIAEYLVSSGKVILNN